MIMTPAKSRFISFKLNRLFLLLLGSLALPVLAQQKALSDCQNITDRAARFACYDQAETAKAIIPKGATQSSIPAHLPSPLETTSATSATPAAASNPTASARVTTVPAEAAKKPFYSRLWPFGKDEAGKPELAKPAAATKPAKAGDEIDNFGRASAASVATDGAGVKELTDTIASIKLVRANSMRVTLSSGQVWRQAIDKAYLLKTGEKVSIRPSGWGDSYRLYSERLGSYIQVDRVDQ